MFSMVLLAACSSGATYQSLDKQTTGAKGMAVGDDREPGTNKIGLGNAAPDFDLVLFRTNNHARGDILRLSSLSGRPVVMNFWFPSCPPCRAEMPGLERTFQKYRVDGVEFVGPQLVGLDSVQDGQDFVDEAGVTYALGADQTGDIVRDYRITAFPTTVFLDSNQNIIRRWTGALSEKKLEEFIDQLLK